MTAHNPRLDLRVRRGVGIDEDRDEDPALFENYAGTSRDEDSRESAFIAK